MRADVRRPEQITNMFREVKAQFGKVEIFVANARPEAAEFFAPATLQQWDTAFDSQAKAFPDRSARGECPNAGGREDNSHDIRLRKPDRRPAALGGWARQRQLWNHSSVISRWRVAKRGITVNAVSPGWTENSVLNSPPDQVQDLIRTWHKRGWTPMGRLGTPEDI